MTKPAPPGGISLLHEAKLLGSGMTFPILEPSLFHGHVDSLQDHLDGVRSLDAETIAGEQCDAIEASLAGRQRIWRLGCRSKTICPVRCKKSCA